MATLVENPLETSHSASQNAIVDDDTIKAGEVIQLKEAKFNEHGVLQIRNAVLDKENIHIVSQIERGSEEGDIIKHDIAKKAFGSEQIGNYDFDGKTDVTASSRPVTGVSVKQIDFEHDTPEKPQRNSHSSPSVKNERKINRTSPNRTQSEYGRSSNVPRQSVIAPGRGRFDPIPSPNKDYRGLPSPPPKHFRVPTKLVRMATVTMSAKTKPAPRAPMSSLYYEEPKKPKKVVGWDEANEARPPLRIDMEGPGPCTYSPMNKPLNETNAPAWSFGVKTQPDKDRGGARTSWEKSWFQSPHLYQQKTDFFSDVSWPTPSTYPHKPLLGPKQRTVAEAPSFTIGLRRKFNMAKQDADKLPSPLDYEKQHADKLTRRTGPSFSHQFRREGTILWSHNEKTPGPAAYTPRLDNSKYMSPCFTIRSLRREKSHVLGPFSTF